MGESREKGYLYCTIESRMKSYIWRKEMRYNRVNLQNRQDSYHRLEGMIDYAAVCGIITSLEQDELKRKIKILLEEVWSVQILLKGYNEELKEWVELTFIDGVTFGRDWHHIMRSSIKRYTGQMDVNKKMLWEDDEIMNESTGTHMFIRYGDYEAYCPVREETVKNVGFYLESEDYPDMPLGDTDLYAWKITPELPQMV